MGFAADERVGENFVVFPHDDQSFDSGVMVDVTTISERDLGADVGVGADGNIFADGCTVFNDGGGVNVGRHLAGKTVIRRHRHPSR